MSNIASMLSSSMPIFSPNRIFFAVAFLFSCTIPTLPWFRPDGGSVIISLIIYFWSKLVEYLQFDSNWIACLYWSIRVVVVIEKWHLIMLIMVCKCQGQILLLNRCLCLCFMKNLMLFRSFNESSWFWFLLATLVVSVVYALHCFFFYNIILSPFPFSCTLFFLLLSTFIF